MGYSHDTSPISIMSCVVNGKLTVNAECAGGIVGYSGNGSTVNITSCFAYGIISGTKYVGGLAGHINIHTIAESGAMAL